MLGPLSFKLRVLAKQVSRDFMHSFLRPYCPGNPKPGRVVPNNCLFIIKGYSSRTARWKRYIRQGMGKGHSTHPESSCVHQPGRPWNPVLQVLCVLHFLGILMATVNWTQSPAPLHSFLPWGWGWDWKFQLTSHIGGSNGNSFHPYVWSQSHLINLTKYILSLLRKFQEF